MPRAEKQLSAVGLKHLEPGLHHDGLGLYLQVTPKKNRSWVFRYMRDRKARYMGLGALHTVGLAKARLAAAEARQQLVAGEDPIAQREELRAAQRREAAKTISFQEAAKRYIAAHQAGWKNQKHAEQWTRSLKRHAYPTIGALAVGDVDVGHIMKILEPIWPTKTETASRVRGRIENIVDWAIARGYRRKGENPARWKGHLDKLLPKKSKVKKVRHFPAMPYAEVPAFIPELATHEGISVLALQFTILTAVRTNETIGATWSEIDEKAALWIIPAEGMKAPRDHRVPLSKAALGILAQVPRIDGVDFVFPGARAGRPLSNMAMLELLQGMKPALTVHGFRSSFRDWAAERTPHPNEVVEMALAHRIKDKTEAAYRRGDLLEKRRKLMQHWADFIVPTARRAGHVRLVTSDAA